MAKEMNTDEFKASNPFCGQYITTMIPKHQFAPPAKYVYRQPIERKLRRSIIHSYHLVPDRYLISNWDRNDTTPHNMYFVRNYSLMRTNEQEFRIGSDCTPDLATSDQENRWWNDPEITDPNNKDWPKSWVLSNTNCAEEKEDTDRNFLFLSVREFPKSITFGHGPPSKDNVYVYMVCTGDVLLVRKDVLFNNELMVIPETGTSLAEFRSTIDRMNRGTVTIETFLLGKGFKYPMNQHLNYQKFEELCLENMGYNHHVPAMDEMDDLAVSMMDLDTVIVPNEEKPEPVTPQPTKKRVLGSISFCGLSTIKPIKTRQISDQINPNLDARDRDNNQQSQPTVNRWGTTIGARKGAPNRVPTFIVPSRTNTALAIQSFCGDAYGGNGSSRNHSDSNGQQPQQMRVANSTEASGGDGGDDGDDDDDVNDDHNDNDDQSGFNYFGQNNNQQPPDRNRNNDQNNDEHPVSHQDLAQLMRALQKPPKQDKGMRLKFNINDSPKFWGLDKKRNNASVFEAHFRFEIWADITGLKKNKWVDVWQTNGGVLKGEARRRWDENGRRFHDYHELLRWCLHEFPVESKLKIYLNKFRDFKYNPHTTMDYHIQRMMNVSRKINDEIILQEQLMPNRGRIENIPELHDVYKKLKFSVKWVQAYGYQDFMRKVNELEVERQPNINTATYTLTDEDVTGLFQSLLAAEKSLFPMGQNTRFDMSDKNRFPGPRQAMIAAKARNVNPYPSRASRRQYNKRYTKKAKQYKYAQRSQYTQKVQYKQQQVCHACKKPGHLFKECRNKEAKSQHCRLNRLCFKCGKEGHQSRDCPQNKGRNPNGRNRNEQKFNNQRNDERTRPRRKPPSETLCRHFARGDCRRGNECRFKHSGDTRPNEHVQMNQAAEFNNIPQDQHSMILQRRPVDQPQEHVAAINDWLDRYDLKNLKRYSAMDWDQIPGDEKTMLRMVVNSDDEDIRNQIKHNGEGSLADCGIEVPVLLDSGASISCITPKWAQELERKLKWTRSKGRQFRVENGGETDEIFSGEYLEIPVLKTNRRNSHFTKFFIMPSNKCSFNILLGKEDMKQIGYKIAMKVAPDQVLMAVDGDKPDNDHWNPLDDIDDLVDFNGDKVRMFGMKSNHVYIRRDGGSDRAIHENDDEEKYENDANPRRRNDARNDIMNIISDVNSERNSDWKSDTECIEGTHQRWTENTDNNMMRNMMKEWADNERKNTMMKKPKNRMRWNRLSNWMSTLRNPRIRNSCNMLGPPIMDSTHDADNDDASTDSEVSGYASYGNDTSSSDEDQSELDDDSNGIPSDISVRKCSPAAGRGGTE